MTEKIDRELQTRAVAVLANCGNCGCKECVAIYNEIISRLTKRGDSQPISTAPRRDGLPIWVRSTESGKWWVAEWNASGDSWADEDGYPCDAGKGTIQVTGTWGSHGGWFQPNELDAWRPLSDDERAVWDEALYQERWGNLPAGEEPFFGMIKTERGNDVGTQ